MWKRLRLKWELLTDFYVVLYRPKTRPYGYVAKNYSLTLDSLCECISDIWDGLKRYERVAVLPWPMVQGSGVYFFNERFR